MIFVLGARKETTDLFSVINSEQTNGACTSVTDICELYADVVSSAFYLVHADDAGKNLVNIGF